MKKACCFRLFVFSWGFWGTVLCAEERAWEAPEGEYRVYALLHREGADEKEASPLRWWVERDLTGSSLTFRFQEGRVFVEEERTGSSNVIAERRIALPEGDDVLELAFIRKYENRTLLVENRILWQQRQGMQPGRAVGWACEGGLSLQGVRIQPVADVFFADDFMRTEEAQSPWDTKEGTWRVSQVEDPARSANAFRLNGAGVEREGRIEAGYDFWDEYDVSVSASSLTGGGFGLLCHGRGDRYFLLRWTDNGLELVKVDGERETVLEKRFEGPRQKVWYRLEMEARLGSLAVKVDGHEAFRVRNTGLCGGVIGLWVPCKHQASFDDMLVVGRGDSNWDFGKGLGPWLKKEDMSLAYARPIEGDVAASVTFEGKRGRVELVLPESFQEECVGRMEWVGEAGTLSLLLRGDRGEKALKEAEVGLSGGSLHELRLSLRNGLAALELDGKEFLCAMGCGRVVGSPSILYVHGDARVVSAQVVCLGKDRLAPVLTEQFTVEDTMRTWASRAGRWTFSEEQKTYWNLSDFPGDFTASLLTKDWPEGEGEYRVFFGLPDRQVQNGTSLALRSKEGHIHVCIEREDKTLGEMDVPLDVFRNALEVRLHRVGDEIAFRAGKQLLLVADPNSLRGDQVGLQSTLSEVGLARLEILPRDAVDYTFHEAPVEWRPDAGEWSVTNRWRCDPRWSWFTGVSDHLALLWSKRSFPSDFTMECYCAFKMAYWTSPHYDRCSDLAVTLCADGKDLSEGYTFIIGAENNTKTLLYRGAELVAETPDFTLPSYRYGSLSLEFLHRRWFNVKIRKRGGYLTLFVDDQPVLEYLDERPLQGDRLALWTWNAGYMYSRVRVIGEGIGEMESPFPLTRTGRDSPRRKGGRPTEALRVYSPTHPCLRCTFDEDTCRWQDGMNDVSGRVARDPQIAKQGKASLRVENPVTGGDFEVRWEIPPIPLTGSMPLSFLYRMSPLVKVNLYLRVNGRLHEIVLGAPQAPVEKAFPLGVDEGFAADETWRRFQWDVGYSLLDAHRGEEKLVLDEIVLGNLSNEGYLQAGLSGNRAGVFYHLDDVCLGSGVGGNRFQCAWEGEGWANYELSHGRSVHGRGEMPQGRLLQWDDLESGSWRFGLAPVGGKKCAYLRFIVDDEAPVWRKVEPRSGSPFRGGEIIARQEDETGLPPDRSGVSVQLACGNEEPREVHWTWEPKDAELHIKLADASKEALSEGPLHVKMEGGVDAAGNLMEPVHWSWPLDLHGDQTAPDPPVLLAPIQPLIDATFDEGLDGWKRRGEETGGFLYRDPTRSSAGSCSLKVVNPIPGGDFGCAIRSEPFDGGRYPWMTFDYAILPGVLVDFVFVNEGDWKNIVFTDNDNPLGSIGAIDDVKTDGEWHSCVFHLGGALRQESPKANSLQVERLLMGDWSWQGNGLGQGYWIDAFKILPVLNSTQGLKVQVSASDPSGIAGVSWELAGSEDVVPDKIPETSQMAVTLQGLGTGTHFLAARVVDGAGNWSEEGKLRLDVDDDPPVLGKLDPAEGNTSGSSWIKVELKDEASGVDLNSLRFKVKDQVYTPKDVSLIYDSAAGILTWDAEAVLPAGVTFEDQAKVPVQVEGCDYAGNAFAPKTWSWVMEYKKDASGPAGPAVSSSTHPLLRVMSFEKDREGWGLPEEDTASKLELTAEGGISGKCIRLTNGAADKAFRCSVYSSKYDLVKYPFLSFDYFAQTPIRLDLMANINGAWYVVRFSDKEEDKRVLGTIPAEMDGKWHHARIHLLSAAQSKGLDGNLVVESIALGDRGAANNPAGVWMLMDNFVVSGGGGKDVHLSWLSLADVSGINSYLVKRTGSISPGEGTGTPVKELSFQEQGLASGTWYYHIQGKDRAGNVGSVSTFVLEVL